MLLPILVFLVINFAALGLGGLFTSSGVTSQWYAGLNKAPWTPPGWAFGAAWSIIMVCFTFFMAYAWTNVANKGLLIGLFSLQWALNVLWTPLFFKYHYVLTALFVIVSLTILVGYFLSAYWPQMQGKSLLVLPYFAWLAIATSLNAYAWLNN